MSNILLLHSPQGEVNVPRASPMACSRSMLRELRLAAAFPHGADADHASG
jgi:hypothetical protein